MKPPRGAEPARVLIVTAGVSVRDRSPLVLLLIWLSNASREPHVAHRVSLIFHRAAHNADERPLAYVPYTTRRLRAGSPYSLDRTINKLLSGTPSISISARPLPR